MRNKTASGLICMCEYDFSFSFVVTTVQLEDIFQAVFK